MQTDFAHRKRRKPPGGSSPDEEDFPLLARGDSVEELPSQARLQPRRYRSSSRPKAAPSKMGFLDNLRNWDKPKRFRYFMLLALSLSGDGWSYEATVIASIIQLPSWIAHLGYADGVIPE
jgi:hypothetical protein